MCTTRKKVCERCGWDFEANNEKCPNCDAPTVTIEGVCVNDGVVQQIKYHPVSDPVSPEGTTLICENCGGQAFKNVTIKIKRR